MNRRATRLTLTASAMLTAAVLAAQSAQPRFTRERAIQPSAAGPQRLRPDTMLLGAGSPFSVASRDGTRAAVSGLSDLRMFDGQGRPIPYLLVLPPPHEPVWLSGGIAPIAATEKTSGFELDLGAVELVDRLRVDGIPAPFLKRLRLEGSGDRERWTLLAAEGTLFDLPDERLRQTELPFARGSYRYFRVTWNDASTGRVPPPLAAFARGVAPAAPEPQATVAVGVERRASEPGRSRYRLTLPAAGLPVVALDLQVSGGHVFRQAVVSESRLTGTEAAPFGLGRATLVRVVRGDAAADALRIPIEPPHEAQLDLTIVDESNAPLEITGAAATLAELPWIYFEAPAVDGVVARYGDRREAVPPVYDLEAVRARLDISSVPDAAWGAERSLSTEPSAAPPPISGGAPLDPAGFRFSRVLPDSGAELLAVPLDAAVLAHSRGPGSRFADVRIVDAANRQVPYILERRDEPLALDVPVRPDVNRRVPDGSPDRNRSVHVIRLPYPRLPGGTLVVETSARVYQRRVQLGLERPPDRRHRAAWFDVMAEQTWKHADGLTPATPLSIQVGTVDTVELLLVVDEGDNAPLPLSGARFLVPSYRLRFYGTGQAGLRLVYGRDDLAAPQYDLALLAPALMGEPAREIAAALEPASSATATDFISRRTFWILLTGAIVVLFAVIVRLVRAG